MSTRCQIEFCNASLRGRCTGTETFSSFSFHGYGWQPVGRRRSNVACACLHLWCGRALLVVERRSSIRIERILVMDKTPTLRIGERFGRFEITDILPAGGMGEVYRAKDPLLQRDVAIKLLLRSDPHDLDRFRREAQTAAGFSHPNIVSIFEFGTEQRGEEGVPYLVMEFIEGASLRARMGAGKEQLLRWLTDVARGLAALH